MKRRFPLGYPSRSQSAGRLGRAPDARPVQPSPPSPAALQAVCRINGAIRRGVAADTVAELMCPEARLPPVCPRAPAVYQQELAVLQQQQGGVSPRNEGPAPAS